MRNLERNVPRHKTMLSLNKSNKRAISSFIAVLLLMILTIAAGLIIYAYSMGYFGSLSAPSGSKAMLIEAVSQDNSQLVIYVKNIGNAALNLDPQKNARIYIDNNLISSDSINADPTNLNEGETSTITVKPIDLNWSGRTVPIKVIANDGTFTLTSFKVTPIVSYNNLILNPGFETASPDPWQYESHNLFPDSATRDQGSQPDGGIGYRGVTDSYANNLPNPNDEIYASITQTLSNPKQLSAIPDTDSTLQFWLRNYGPAENGYDTVEVRIISDTKTLSYIWGGTRSDTNTAYIQMGTLPDQDSWTQIRRNLYSDWLGAGLPSDAKITGIELRSNGSYINDNRMGQIIRWDDLSLLSTP
jgi:FlaG/FlaF family flagellin (archaellin)